MAQHSPEGCKAAFAWLTELLALDIHSLRQLQSGAVYLMALDAFHNGAVTIEKVVLDACMESEFRDNYKELKLAFERLKILKFLDRQRLITSASPHASILSWMYLRYRDMPLRPDFSPAAQQCRVWKHRSAAGPDQDAAEPHAHGTEARAAGASPAGSKGASKVPRLELGGLTGKPLPVESTLLPSGAAGSGQAARPGSMPQGFGSDFGDAEDSLPATSEDSLVFQPSPLRGLPAKTPRLFSSRSDQDRPASGEAVRELKQRLALHSSGDLRHLQSFPIMGLPSPQGSPQQGRVHERKAGFSHGGIPPSAIMNSQVQVSGDAWVPDAGMTAPAKPVGPNAAECIPWLSALGAKAAPKRTSQASLAAAAAASQGPHAARAGVPAQRAQQGAAAAAPAACAATPAKERPAPQADAGQPGRGGQSMVTDSAGSMNGRGRTLRRTCDPAEVVLTPTKKLCLNASVDKVEAADLAAQSAAVAVLKALPELQLMLKDFGSANRDGYLHRGKLRCRRWMIGTLIPQTRELLQHVRKLSQLAGADDASARARSRRARRSLKELNEAEQAFKDVCDQISKAERFFPVPGAPGTVSGDAPARGVGGARQLEVSLKGIGQAQAELQTVWVKIAPNTSWSKASKSPPPRGEATQAPVDLLAVLSDEEGSDDEEVGQCRSPVAFTSAAEDAVCAQEAQPGHSALAAENKLSEPKEPYVTSMDELVDTAAKRAAAGLCSRSVPAHPGSWALPGASRATTPADEGLPSSGWVTFGGSSPDSPPRSPIHDAWATPSAASSAAHELPVIETSAAMHRLQLEPSAASDMQMDMPEIEECSVTTEDAHDSGRSMHPGPVLHHEALEQDGLPRAALYVPGNPSLLAVSCDEQLDSKARREAHGHMDARVSSASSAEGRGHMGGHASLAEGLMERSSSAPDQALGIGRMLSIKDRIAALESCNSQSLILGRKGRCARSASLDREGDLPSMPNGLPDAGTTETADAECAVGVTITLADSREETAGRPCIDEVKATAAAPADDNKAAASLQAEDAAVIGTETFPDCMYVGAFKHGMRDGLGVCHYMNGSYFEGEWKAGFRHGRGMQQCADGSNYVGEYVEGLREGCGVYVFPNGDRYEGECLGDLPEGHGVYRFQVSGAVCEGTWRAGAKHGFFIVTVGCKRSCGQWESGELRYMAEVTPLGAELACLEGADEEERRIPGQAAEVAKAARAAATRAARMADEHWSSTGPTQKAIQAVLLRSQLP